MEKETCLANQNFNLVSVERQTGHRGGGPALITKENIKIYLIESRMMKIFEFTVWNLKMQKQRTLIYGSSPTLEDTSTHRADVY